ncbi:Non-specific serine/threonine protein kinase [Sulfidibacter corallicola]|uniref:Tetratricopeptide repeat protein n=1 Tax=Sulfidibacter corallicola TaxID=2818388 RepID=A0A8A4U2E8_SULCO|nr:serine/threonine-protein kinase [Sulfidibacter corallicola]QTD52905.1 tetratricopeptide repeat protein [Sulfidibacter corallicola]
MVDEQGKNDEAKSGGKELFEGPTKLGTENKEEMPRKAFSFNEFGVPSAVSLDAPTLQNATTDDCDDFRETIGPYRIVKELGHGGMGTVYLAEQTENVTRKVALKVVHASLRDSMAMARFAAERQAMARLSHPYVAQLYEAGTTERGFPFFAMEYIEGETLSHYCDTRKLTIEDRLRLFIKICEGVQHAHQKGVMHRDLKPSNLMVAEHDRQVIPKIIDFGIAKAIDQPLTEGETLTKGGVIGTPLYMSPEAIQAPGSVDTRGDVYSLGLVLYELLAGIGPKREFFGPFPAPLASEDTERPSNRVSGLDQQKAEEFAQKRGLHVATFVKTLKGDLDWITLKAIESEPDQRYGSAAELAADIKRFLSHHPVQARAPRLSYRIAKYIRRHRTGVFAATIALLALVGGVIGTSTGMIKARRAESESRLQAQRADAEAEAATEVSAFMTELFELSDPSENRGEELTVRELLDKGAARITTNLGNQPVTQARLAHTLGKVYYNLSLFKEAEALLKQAVALREAHLGDHLELVDNLLWLGMSQARMGRVETAKKHFERMLTLAQSLAGPESFEAAQGLYAMGSVAHAENHLPDAERLFRKSVNIYEKTIGRDRHETARAIRALALVLDRSFRLEEALTLHSENLRIVEKISGSDSYEAIRAHFSVGVVLMMLYRYEESDSHLTKSLALAEKKLQPGHFVRMEAMRSMAQLRFGQKRYRESADLFRNALASADMTYSKDNVTRTRIAQQLGLALRELGLLQEAADVFRQIVDHGRGSSKLDPSYGWALLELSDIARQNGNFDKAESLIRKAGEDLAEAWGKDSVHVAFGEIYAANILRDRGRYDQAEERYKKILDTFERKKTVHTDFIHLAVEYAELLSQTGRQDEADALLARYPEKTPENP